MGNILVLAGSPRKNGNTDRLVASFVKGAAEHIYFYGISAQLKAVVDRLHTPMRDRFHIKRIGLILVGAAELPELFDAIITQYRLVANFFKLEDTGMVLVRGARDKGDVREEDLRQAYCFGQSIR